MICKQCGNELKNGALFCTNCGAKQVPDENGRVIASDDEKTVGIFGSTPVSQTVTSEHIEVKANTCKKCGFELKDGAVFCTNCGCNQNEVSEESQQNLDTESSNDASVDSKAEESAPSNVAFCKKCGAELKNGAFFCTNCGFNQNEQAEMQNSSDDEKTIGVFGTNPVAPNNQTVNTVHSQNEAFHQNNPQTVHQQSAATQNVNYQKAQAYDPNAQGCNNGKVSFIEAIKLFFVNYVNFSGRASKSEYWWGFLFQLIVLGVTTWIPVVGQLVALGVFLPGLSLNIRRLHDIGKAWYYLLMGLIPLAGIIILIVYYCQDSDGDNQWGYATNHNSQVSSGNVSSIATNQRVVTDNDIYVMAQNHNPTNLNDPSSKWMLDEALMKIIPTYNGNDDVASAMMLCNPQDIKSNISATDTDTLLVVFKALGYYIGLGSDPNVLGMVQQSVLATLKSRF